MTHTRSENRNVFSTVNNSLKDPNYYCLTGTGLPLIDLMLSIFYIFLMKNLLLLFDVLI